jgi:hypothetical protein
MPAPLPLLALKLLGFYSSAVSIGLLLGNL